MKSNKKILLVGYIGGINIGDEAIAAVVARKIYKDYDVSVTIATGDPENSKTYVGNEFSYIEANYPGPRLNLYSWYKLIKEVASSDGVFFVGGGLLQDVHSTNLMQNSVCFASLAKIFNKPVVSLGIGAGPIKSRDGRLLAKYFSQCNDNIIFRDKYSMDYITSLDSSYVNRFSVGFDSILLAKVDSSPKQCFTSKIGLCLREWDGLIMNDVFSLSKRLLDKYEKLVFFAYEESDIQIFNLLEARYGNCVELAEDKTLGGTFDNIRQLNGLVSMRLHANLFAALSGVCFVALAYDKKLQTVLDRIGLKERVLPLNASAERIIDLLDKPYENNGKQLILAKNKQIEKYQSLVDFLDEENTKISLVAKVKFVFFFFHRFFIFNFFRHFVIAISPILSFAFSDKFKSRIKKVLKINW